MGLFLLILGSIATYAAIKKINFMIEEFFLGFFRVLFCDLCAIGLRDLDSRSSDAKK
jgi:hypothetical protein